MLRCPPYIIEVVNGANILVGRPAGLGSSVREHNVKNIDRDLPRDVLVVFTAVSGSCKSSFVFGGLYAKPRDVISSQFRPTPIASFTNVLFSSCNDLSKVISSSAPILFQEFTTLETSSSMHTYHYTDASNRLWPQHAQAGRG